MYRSRSERACKSNKEELEKARLCARNEGFYGFGIHFPLYCRNSRYTLNEDIIRPPIGSPAYLCPSISLSRRSNIDRMNSSDILCARDRDIEVCRRNIENFRSHENHFKKACVEATSIEKTKLNDIHASGLKAKVNIAGAPFNIINMEYNRTADGDRLKLHDKLQKYRHSLRSYNLAVRNHVGLDPISGCQSFDVSLPKFYHD